MNDSKNLHHKIIAFKEGATGHTIKKTKKMSQKGAQIIQTQLEKTRIEKEIKEMHVFEALQLSVRSISSLQARLKCFDHLSSYSPKFLFNVLKLKIKLLQREGQSDFFNFS